MSNAQTVHDVQRAPQFAGSLCGLLCNNYSRIYNRQPKIRLSSAKSCSLLAQSVTQSSPQPLYAPPPRLAGRTITKGSPQAETGPHSARSSDSGLRDVRATLGRWYGCSLLRFAACFLMARTFGARELGSLVQRFGQLSSYLVRTKATAGLCSWPAGTGHFRRGRCLWCP